MISSLSFVCLVCCSVFVRCIDLRAYGYIYNIYGDNLLYPFDFETIYFPRITAELPEYNQSTIYNQIVYFYQTYFMSFTFELTDIDAEYHFDLDNITENINNPLQNSEYIVISGIDVGIFSDYAGSSNIEIHLQNDKAWSIMYGNHDTSIISFTVIGSAILTQKQDVNDQMYKIEDVQYDLFYPNRDVADSLAYSRAYKSNTINDSNDSYLKVEVHYTQFNTEIMYKTDVNKFENDIEQNNLFDINLMNEKYNNITNNGSFMYYGLGGICSGTLCTKYINWTEPVFDEIISTTRAQHSTEQPEVTDSAIKFGTPLNTIISSLLFIISIQ